MDDANWPWVILVPRRPGVREIHELSDEDQVTLIRESSQVAGNLIELFSADKLNVAALGNLVPQLHLHHAGIEGAAGDAMRQMRIEQFGEQRDDVETHRRLQ